MEGLGMRPNPAFWRGKKVLVTGHTGFKGAWLCFWLKRLGAEVTGIAIPPETTPNLFTEIALENGMQGNFVDIRNYDPLKQKVQGSGAEIVFHLAAQALVRQSYAAPLATFEANIMGTAHVLEALRDLPSAKAGVIVTTDKVYRNLELQEPFVEDDPLGGHDPYSASKAAAEIVVESYRESFLKARGVAVASARAGNVIGGGDWSPERLLPDCVKAWATNETVDIRMPGAIRPWQHVLDPLAGYLVLAQHLWTEPSLASTYNFGPHSESAVTVREAVTLAQMKWGTGAKVKFAESDTGPKEAKTLRLSNAKAKTELGFVPLWPLEAALARTIAWYKGMGAGEPASALCTRDIDAYESGRE